MAQIESQNNPSAFYNIFKISLTRQQQMALTTLLPSNFSFQPFKCTRSLDDESLRSEPMKMSKKKMNRQQRDPDYSASYVAGPKEPPQAKVESTQVIPGGQPFLQCYLILKKLKKSIYSWPFKIPVDPKALGIPEYLNVVLEPMDLKTIEDNLRKESYKHPGEFHRDIYKILMNSYKFNQKNSEVFATTVEFQEEYLKIVKEAKEGKLTMPEKRIKIQGSMEEETPMIVREKSSVQHKPRPYHKKEKVEKEEEFQIEREREKPKEREIEKVKEEKIEKVVEKITQKVKEKKEEKEKDKVKDKEKAEKVKERAKEKQKHKEKEREKEKELEKDKIKMEQIQRDEIKEKEKRKEIAVQSYSQLFEDFKEKNDELMEFSEIFEPNHKEKSIAPKEERDDISVSNDPAGKKKEKLGDSKVRQKKQKEKNELTESLKQIKELKQVTQVQNEKGIILSSIQKKLTDLLKKLSEYQLPKPKQKAPPKHSEGDHPNFNNFSNITTSEKKKLAQKISLLPSSELKYVIEICYRSKRDKKRDEEGIYEFDLEKTDAKTLKELSNFVAMRTKQIKKMPRAKNDSSRVPSSQMQAAEQPFGDEIFKFGVDEQQQDEFPQIHYDSQHRQRILGNIGSELILDHPGDDIHSHMFQQDFHFPVGELMEIDDNGGRNSDSYQPDQDNYHHF